MTALRTTIPTPIAAIPVAIYTRVSTQHQVGGRFDSCESQASICREYLARHAEQGWYEAALYSDPAYSGGTLKRPGMEALMHHIASGGVKIVLIFKFERVLRSTDEWGPFRNFLKKHGCRLQSPMENLNEDTAMDRFQNNLRANLAEFDRYNTAEKVRAKMLEQAKRGYWNCGPVPFGYNYDSEQQRLYPHADESPIVARIFKEAAELVSLTDLANALGREGIRTRVRQIRRRDGSQQIVGGKRFRSDGLRLLIKNPIYAGKVRFLGTEYAAQHEALVSTELWEQANAAAGHGHPTARRLLPDHDKHFHLLKGVLRCEHCDRTMIPNASGKPGPDGRPYRYYTCCNAQKERSTAACPVRHISAASAERAVVGLIGRLALDPEVITGATATAREEAKPARAPLQQSLVETDLKIAQLSIQVKNCIEAISLGGAELLSHEIGEHALALKDEKRRLIVHREQLRQSLRARDENAIEPDRIRRAMAHLGSLLTALPQAEQKHLIGLCFAQIRVRANQSAARLPGHRRIDLICSVRVARLVESMESKMTMHHTGPNGATTAERKLVLPIVLDLNANGTVTVLSPFEAVYGERRLVPSKPCNEPRVRHPIHRAMAWRRLLDTTPRLTQARLAERENIKAATVTYHMNLLRLAPAIRAFLCALSTARSVRHFGLVRMRDLSKLSLAAQRRQFAVMRKCEELP